ncbi:hypothetical protein EDC04DRAFT_2871942 [Pisolithus marmoratus]|nr:hypothetical protein EDC04DRAFT_2871942 [Pisolithus marmoratus]
MEPEEPSSTPPTASTSASAAALPAVPQSTAGVPPPSPSTGAAPLMSVSVDDDISLMNVITAITTATSAPHLSQYLKNFAPKEVREVVLASMLPEGQDPLTILDIQANTLGILYILSARLHVPRLQDLLPRYAPSPSHLTTIHPIFARVCVASLAFTAALPEYLEICACSPGTVPAAIQLEALKKLVLVQLIRERKTSPLPKYTHPDLSGLFKNTSYSTFVNAYRHQRNQLRSIAEAEGALFSSDKTLGLISEALERAPRWSIRKLTATYLTLHLSDIGQAVGIESEGQVRALILDMIQSSETCARLSADGTVSFSEPPVQFKKADVDKVLENAQNQCALLARLEREMAGSKEYLAKAVKGEDDSITWLGAPAAVTEDLSVERIGPNFSWAEDVGFL